MKSLLLSLIALFAPPKRPSPDTCAALLTPHQTIAENFARFSDDQTLQILRANYSELFTWLTQKTDATVESGGRPGIGDYGPSRTDSPSRFLFGRDLIEVDRAVVGLLALKWLLADDYERFTARQGAAGRLTRASFAELRGLVRSVLNTPGDLDAMIVMILTNDLGKVRRYHELTERGVGRVIVDHDELLFAGFNEWPETSPSFHRLPPEQRRKIIAGLSLGSSLNIGQLVQGENLPVNLEAVRGLAGDRAAFEFKFVELLLDVAGARGHVDSRGALVMNETAYQGFRLALSGLRAMIDGATARSAYDVVLNGKARALGLPELTAPSVDPRARAILRLNALTRSSSAGDAAMLADAFDALPSPARWLLEEELNVDGTGDAPGMIPYYAPAFFANAIESLGPLRRAEALRVGLLSLSRVYQAARRTTPGLITVNFEDLATYVKPRADGSNPFRDDPDGLMDHDFTLDQRPDATDSFTLRLVKRRPIAGDQFPAVTVKQITSSKSVVIVGVGGGSDVIQAAQLGHALRAAGTAVRALVSFRRIENDGDEFRGYHNVDVIGSHLARIYANTTGPGRVLEPLVAEDVPTLLATIRPNGRSAHQILEVVRQRYGTFEEIILVDTGGDCLYPAAASGYVDQAKATPDQDLQVLRFFRDERDRKDPRLKLTVAIVAVGVDSPDDAADILKVGAARYWSPTAAEAASLLERYERWNFTGRSEVLFGKTPYAWQAALLGGVGTEVLPLPRSVVMDRINPWSPFARVPARGVFFLPLDDYFRATNN